MLYSKSFKVTQKDCCVNAVRVFNDKMLFFTRYKHEKNKINFQIHLSKCIVFYKCSDFDRLENITNSAELFVSWC